MTAHDRTLRDTKPDDRSHGPRSPRRLREPIFLLGSHKSGTSLLRALMDGHPAVAALPKEAHFFQFSGLGVEYALRRARPRQLGLEERREGLIEGVRTENTSSDPYADSAQFSGYDVDRIAADLRSVELDSVEVLFHAYHTAIARSLDADDRRIVEKSVENAERATVIRSLCPDARFVHIVRNPYATLVALRRAKGRGRILSLRGILCSLERSLWTVFSNPLAIRDGYLIIRFEDLLADPAATMKKVAAHLEIDFHESLLSPSMAGETWLGNSTSAATAGGFRGVSTAPLHSWKSRITDLEIHLVNRFASPILEAFEYERLEPKRSVWLPARGELPRGYVMNRLCAALLARNDR